MTKAQFIAAIGQTGMLTVHKHPPHKLTFAFIRLGRLPLHDGSARPALQHLGTAAGHDQSLCCDDGRLVFRALGQETRGVTIDARLPHEFQNCSCSRATRGLEGSHTDLRLSPDNSRGKVALESIWAIRQ